MAAPCPQHSGNPGDPSCSLPGPPLQLRNSSTSQRVAGSTTQAWPWDGTPCGRGDHYGYGDAQGN